MINFRDLGNVQNNAGKTVVSGKLFRSGELCDLSPTDKHYLESELQLKRIVDFRSESERLEKPDDVVTGATYTTIDIMSSSNGNTASFEDLMNGKSSAEKRMENIYEELIISESALKGYQAFFEIVVEKANVPLVFHCFAGKDRTGIGAALILKMLDVPPEAIMADYLATNAARKKANDGIIQQILATYQVFDRGDLETLLTVQPSFLEYAQQLVQKHYGGFEGYLQNGLQLPKDFTREMQQLYLV